MKKLFVPLMFTDETYVLRGNGGQYVPGCDPLTTFGTMDEAKEAAKHLSLAHPKGKVVIFEAVMVIEPRKVEFSEKVYNGSGELIV